MGKSAPKPPPAPDPAETAKAQGAANLETAIAQGYLGAVNQYTPYGNITFGEDGTVTVGDKEVPRFTQTVSLSPEQQAQFDLQNQLQMQALNLGQGVLGNVENAVGQPFYDQNSFTEDRDNVVNAIIERNQPQMDRTREMQQSQLANQGIPQGSEAYENAMDDLARQENDFRLAAIQAGGAEQNRLFGLAQAARSQPINEYATLLGLGGQVQTPQGQGFSVPQLAGTDVVGPRNLAYQGQLAGYNASNAANQSFMGNLFGLGGSLGAAAILSPGSDIRIKEDIRYVGQEHGHNIYTFKYIDDPAHITYRGVMAQEVAHIKPDAVIDTGEYLAVDYSKLPVEFGVVH